MKTTHHGKRASLLTAAGLFLIAALGVAAEPLPRDRVEIGRRLELFVDMHMIQSLTGARLVLHQPVEREIVLVCDKPWEGSTCAYFTVFKDEDVYRMYYRGGWGHKIYCYAESADGIHWTKPNLGLFEFNGSKDNNIVLMGEGTEAFAPFRDLNPACTPDARYKALAVWCKSTGAQGVAAYKSPDGIHWSRLGDTAVITKGHFDSQNLAFWDTERGRYVEFHRWYKLYPGSDVEVRDIMTGTSTDFVNWTEPRELEYPGSPPEDLYTSQVVAYGRAPHIFMGFPMRLLPFRRVPGNAMEALSDGVFMTSRDGRTFHRWQEAFIRPGQNRERWYNRNNLTAWGIVETASGNPGSPVELSLYATEGYYETRAVKLRRFTLRPDGFVSVNAPLRGGEVLTKPLVFAAPETSLPAPARPPEPIVRAEDNPIVGKASLRFIHPAALPIPAGRDLGREVTLAAHFKGLSSMTPRRLWAACNGGPFSQGDRQLVVDMGVSHANGPALRFIYSGMQVIVPMSVLGRSLWTAQPHHVAVTWDDGLVKIYVDGKQIADGGSKGAGNLSLAADLRLGEGYPGLAHFDRPFCGDRHNAMVDDVLILRRVLSAEEAAAMARDGARAVVDPDRDKGILYTMEEDTTGERRIRDSLPADGAADTELPLGGIEWGDVQLLVNYSTSAAGSLRCEIQDADGQPIPGFSMTEADLIIGDDIERPVSWNGKTDLKLLVGKPVRLRFEIKDADLYAIRFGQASARAGK